MRTLSLLVFTTGFVTLAVELSASRLLEPAFGNNQLIWAALIGMILLYLAVGAWVGGKLADRFPHRLGLTIVLTVAACGVAVIPSLSRQLLQMAVMGMESFTAGPLVGSLVAIVALFSIPVVLLGTASPWAVRLAMRDLTHTGEVAGRFSAFATLGSLVGAFVPVLWLIPAYGTRWTFYLLALTLLVVLVLTHLQPKLVWIPLLGLLVVLVLMFLAPPTGSIRAGWEDGGQGEVIYEDESDYNYIAVRQWGSERHLKLNDGTGIHSVYHPDSLLSLGIWDYFLLAPLFKKELRDEGRGARGEGRGARGEENPRSEGIRATRHLLPANLLIIGSAAGTVSELFTNLYGSIPITGIELDPQIIKVGRTYFNMNQPNLTAIAADGRQWLARQPVSATWQMVAVDAYRPPYIPFHLTTQEFFQLVHSHLSADGVLAINVGRTSTNYALVDALAATAGTVFPTIFLVDEPGPDHNLGNTLLVATVQATPIDSFIDNLAQLPPTMPTEFIQFAQATAPAVRLARPQPALLIFTDDHAPVEWVVHRIIWDFLMR